MENQDKLSPVTDMSNTRAATAKRQVEGEVHTLRTRNLLSRLKRMKKKTRQWKDLEKSKERAKLAENQILLIYSQISSKFK